MYESIRPSNYRIHMEVSMVRVIGFGLWTSSYPVCPRCGRTMDREYQSFCDRCGQALSWRRFGRAGVVRQNRPVCCIAKSDCHPIKT